MNVECASWKVTVTLPDNFELSLPDVVAFPDLILLPVLVMTMDVIGSEGRTSLKYVTHLLRPGLPLLPVESSIVVGSAL